MKTPKKVISIRMKEEVFEDLKILAAMEEKCVGDYVAYLVRQEIKREERKSGRKREKWGGSA